MLAIGPPGEFHLQKAHLDSHLQHFAAIVGAHQTRSDHTGLKWPLAKKKIDVLLLVWFLRLSHRCILPH